MTCRCPWVRPTCAIASTGCAPPPWLHAYFALPQVPACVVGLDGSTLDGRVLQHDDGVYPCWAVLPMGFT
eukprot:12095367-Heterocapsa_arctica.AAC.1